MVQRLLVASLVLFGLLPFCSSSSCPNNCAICLSAIYVCNKWKTFFDLTSYNEISTINTNAFINAGGVIGLDMSTNSISSLQQGGFNGLVNLQTLDLSHNQIHLLPDGIFQPMINLKTLDLSNNQLTQLNPNAFAGLTNLTKLYLHNNLITSMTDNQITDLLANLPSLQNITLSANRWNCDCNTTALQNLLMSTVPHINDKSSVTCHTPAGLSGSAIVNLDFYEEPLCFSMIPSPSPSLLPFFSSSLLPFVSLLSPSPSLEFLSSFQMIPTSFIPSSSISPSLFFSDEFIESSLMPSSTLSVSVSSSSFSPSISSPSPSLSSTFPTLSSTHSPSLSLFTPSPTSSSRQPQPTPSPVLQCPQDTTITDVGTISWGATSIHRTAESVCPYGPANSVALRICIISPQNEPLWGDVQDGGCFNANNYLQQIFAQGVTIDNALSLSNELSLLPFDFLSEDGLALFADITSQLVRFGQTDITILVSVLSSIDLLLASSNSQLLLSNSKEMLQATINTALLEAVNVNNTELVFQFSHLLIGGKYVEEDDILIDIDTQQGQLHFVTSFDNNSLPEIAIEIHGSHLNGHSVQVSIYNDTDIFNGKCAVNIDECNVQVVSSVVVIETDILTGNETVDIVYENIMMDSTGTLHCAVWNGSSSRGIWNTTHCQTGLPSKTTVKCTCAIAGPIALIQIPNLNNTNPSNVTPIDQYNQVIVASFYVASGIGVLLHIPVIIASLKVSCKYDYVRNIQALLSHSITQILVFIVMMISFQRNEIYELCLAMGSFLHYIILVSFIWLLFRPIVLLFSQIRRTMYEKDCFILPFFFMSWTLPIVPVVLYGVLAFIDNKVDSIDNCWLETLSFPNYFTYLCLVCIALVTLMTSIAALVLACSGYTVTSRTYFQLLNIFIETIVFSLAIFLHFIAASFKTDVYLITTSGLILFCGMYFFTANGLIRTRIRNTLFCLKEEKVIPGRPFAGQDTPTSAASLSTSGTLVGRNQKSEKSSRVPSRQNVDRYYDNLDYIGFHLGYPIQMYNEVVEGNRVRKKKGFLSNEHARSSEV